MERLSALTDRMILDQARRAVSPTAPSLAGLSFARLVIALAISGGGRSRASDIAEDRWSDTPLAAILRVPIDVLQRTAVNAGTSSDAIWAGPLVQYQNIASEFAALLRPRTVIGRLAGLRKVPFKCSVPLQSAGASVSWVGEAKVTPLSSLSFDMTQLGITKISGIIPLSQELVKLSSPSAEMLVRDDLIAATAQFTDREFLDPSKAEMVGVSPASVLYGTAPIIASGATATALRTDLKALIAAYLAANASLAGAVLIMTETQAVNIAMMQNSVGGALYPGITAEGGTMLGLNVVTSENIVSIGGSPADGSLIALVGPGQILLADDSGTELDVSSEATLQMEASPDSPVTPSTVAVSLWQQGLVGVKIDRLVAWKKIRSGAAMYIQNAKYFE